MIDEMDNYMQIENCKKNEEGKKWYE